MAHEYRMEDGGMHHRFSKQRTKVQVLGGGFGNGKTAAACVLKALPVARDYPGCNILIARSTYPKLNDTIRKEFLKWCPPHWIASFPLSKNSDNTCKLKNGSTINFRYIAQQGKGASEGEQTTSNLLSATYDLIIVDQMEDPEIVEKDYYDLLGRLRGNAKYIGSDPTMPLTGPRWFVICTNPTRNWLYQSLIRPLKNYQEHGIIDEKLQCVREPLRLPNGEENPDADKPVLDENGKAQLLISLEEGSTYENAANLGADFIQTLESSYKGKMRERFLYGDWAAYDGLIYPEYSAHTHMITYEQAVEHFNNVVRAGLIPRWLEGYDFGNTSPSCYLAAFVDRNYNIIVVDGFYHPYAEKDIEDQQRMIWDIRDEWGIGNDKIRADPAIFKKSQLAMKHGNKSETIADMFGSGLMKLKMTAADNAINSGIIKVSQYLAIDKRHRNPFTGEFGSPRLFFVDKLGFVSDEMGSYFWKKDSKGDPTDEPVDKNDHAMDTTKYLLSDVKQVRLLPKPLRVTDVMNQWQEGEFYGQTQRRNHRHG